MQEPAFRKGIDSSGWRAIRRVAPYLALLLLTVATPALVRKDPDEVLKRNLKDKDLVGEWVYDDIDKGYALAKQSGKPLMIVFRCVP